jgi:pyruvate/2-oxoglutarate/acetoin dehydrogenase E1 component
LLNSNFFKGEDVRHYKHNGLHKYTVGDYKKYGEARQELQRLVEKGFVDAFIIKLKNGKRID